jgi:hypothetical protein
MDYNEPQTARERAEQRWSIMQRLYEHAMRSPKTFKDSRFYVREHDRRLLQRGPMRSGDNVIPIQHFQ